MEDRLLKFLDFNQYLRDHIDVFKEYFIRFYSKFYGEGIREEIEEKFSKCLFIGHQEPARLKTILNKIAKGKSNELIDSLLKDSSVPLTKEDLFSDYEFTYSSLQPIHKYLEFYKLYQLGEDGRKNEFYQEKYLVFHKYLPELTFDDFVDIVQKQEIPNEYVSLPLWLKGNFDYVFDSNNITKKYLDAFQASLPLLSKVDSSITQDNFNEKLQESKFLDLNQLVERYAGALDEFSLYMSKFQSYTDYVSDAENLDYGLRDKYYAKFIQENLDLIPVDKRDGLEEFFENPSNSYKLNSYIKDVFGYSLFGDISLFAFSKENEEMLHNKDARAWLVSETKNKRISYFKANGIDFGDRYEDYLDKEQVKAVWPSYERIEQLQNSHDEILNQYHNEYFDSLSENKKIRQEIEERNLLDKNDSFDAAIYEKHGTFLNPNVTLTSNGYDLSSLLLVKGDYDSNFNDHDIVHELNHLFELFLDNVNDDHYSVIVGWDRLNEAMAKSKNVAETVHISDEKRPYELFNEIMNELISQDICKMMHDDGVFVFDDPKDSRYKNITSYEHSLFLVREFYEQNQESIIRSRRNGNIELIYDTVGQENFDGLNSLFETYYETFSGFRIYSLQDSLSKHEDTPATRVYYDLIDRKNRVMMNMDLHKAGHVMETQKTSSNSI